jgi:P27 family predicted phage terminase small subunit
LSRSQVSALGICHDPDGGALMGRRGPKPEPTNLRILRGNPGRRRLPDREVQPDATPPACPDHLDDEARREWNRVIGELSRLGLVTTLDRAALAAYCHAWSRWIGAEAKLKEFGTIIKSPNGYPIMSPYLSIANTALKQMRDFLVEFGMSPQARHGLETTPPSEPHNPLTALKAKKSAAATRA